MERTLAQSAAQLGLTRPKLIALMREKGLLKGNLPADPERVPAGQGQPLVRREVRNAVQPVDQS
jgi:hypothetical protein